MKNFQKAYNYLQRNGFKKTYYAVRERLTKDVPYEYMEPSMQTLQAQKAEFTEYPVEYSIVVPVYKTPEKFLCQLIESCLNQSYGGWELILADATEIDFKGVEPSTVAARYDDPRIKYVNVWKNNGISVNTNEGVRHATKEFTCLVDHDDLLTKDALYEVTKAILRSREKGNDPAFIYTNEDKCNSDATDFFDPNIKPGFNLDYLLSNNYICHLTILKTDIVRELKLRREYDGAQDHDLVLRAYGVIKDEKNIVHVPKVLYHWRTHAGSTAGNPQSKQYAYDAGGRAISDFVNSHFSKNDFHIEVTPTEHVGFYHVNYGRYLFELRPDVGAVGGLVSFAGRISGGLYDAKGICPYVGMNVHFSGPRHRLHCMQDTYALDIRNLTPAPILRRLHAEAYYHYLYDLGHSVVMDANVEYNILTKWNLWFADEAHRMGYRFLFDPEYKEGTMYHHIREKDRLPVSVVIPNLNGEEYLQGCLDSILLQTKLPEEVIIVDNASKDRSEEIVRNFIFNNPQLNVRILQNQENYGFTGAVNHGTMYSSCPFVFLLNNDTTVFPDCIEKLYDAMADDHSIFSAGALMLQMDHPDRVDNAGDSYTIFGWGRNHAYNRLAKDFMSDSTVEVFSTCAGAAMYRHELLDLIGRFDDNHFAYLEDIDVGYRARLYGYRNISVRNACVYHKGSAASGGARHNKFKVKLSAKNAVLLARKNQAVLQFLCNLPFLFIGYLIKQLFFLCIGLGVDYFVGTMRGFFDFYGGSSKRYHVIWLPSKSKRMFKIQMDMIKGCFPFLFK